jgi:hypothetical protein
MRRPTARMMIISLALSVTVVLPATSADAATAIGPGTRLTVRLDASSSALCTAGFAFRDAAGATYLGTAAHCTGTGTGDVAGSGCVEGSLPLGTPVRIGDGARGRLAYSSWIAMQSAGESDEERCRANDFGLVAVDPADAGRVDPTVPVVGGPTGLDTDGVPRGETVASYQPGDGARAVKTGRSLGDTPYAHTVLTRPPGIPGDSGAGFLDGDGRAFGALTTEFDGTPHANGVADLADALDYARTHGGPDVRLLTGTVGSWHMTGA